MLFFVTFIMIKIYQHAKDIFIFLPSDIWKKSVEAQADLKDRKAFVLQVVSNAEAIYKKGYTFKAIQKDKNNTWLVVDYELSSNIYKITKCYTETDAYKLKYLQRIFP